MKSIYISQHLLGKGSNGIVKFLFRYERDAARYEIFARVEDKIDLLNKSIKRSLEMMQPDSSEIDIFIDGRILEEDLIIDMENIGDITFLQEDVKEICIERDVRIISSIQDENQLEYFRKETEYLKKVPFF